MTSLKLQLSKATLIKNSTETEPSFKLRIRAGADSVVWGLSLPAEWTVSQLWLAWVGKTIHWHPRKGQWWNDLIRISQSLSWIWLCCYNHGQRNDKACIGITYVKRCPQWKTCKKSIRTVFKILLMAFMGG